MVQEAENGELISVADPYIVKESFTKMNIYSFIKVKHTVRHNHPVKTRRKSLLIEIYYRLQILD